MALELNLYLAPRLGDGLTSATAFRSLLCEIAPTTEFDEVDHHHRRISLCIVVAEPAVHQTIQADSRVTRIFPVVSVTAAQLRANLDNTVVSTGAAHATTLKALLETHGVDTSWAGAATTWRELIRRLIRFFTISGLGARDSSPGIAALMQASLTARVNTLSTAQRTDISAWCAANGISMAWVTGTTTIRAAAAYIVANYPHPAVNFGGIESF